MSNPHDLLKHYVSGAIERGEGEPIIGQPQYPPLNAFDAVMIAEGVEDADEVRQLDAWQFLHDTGLAYKLQGWFGRRAQDLITQGLIHE